MKALIIAMRVLSVLGILVGVFFLIKDLPYSSAIVFTSIVVLVLTFSPSFKDK